MAECSTSELCAQRRPKLTLLHSLTDLFRNEILPHSSEYLQGYYNQLYMLVLLLYRQYIEGNILIVIALQIF